MKRNLTLGLLAIVIAGGLLIASVTAAISKEPFIIGVLYPRTGAGASQGVPAIASVEIAVEEINAQGGIMGRPLKMILLDDKSNPQEGLRHAKTLVQEHKADVLIGGGSSAVAVALVSYVKNVKKLYIMAMPASSRLTEELFNPYVVRISHNTTSISRATCYGAAKIWGDKKAYQINHDYEYGHQTYKEVKEIYTSLVPDVEWVGESWVPFPSQDFTPYLSKIITSGAELVFDSIWGGDGLALLKQAVAFGLYDDVHSAGQVGDLGILSVIRRGDPAPIGALGATPYPFWELKNPLSEKFWPKCYKRSGFYPGHTAAFGYTAPYALKAAIEKAGSFDTEKIIKAFEGLEIDSIVGKIKIRDIDHQALWPYFAGIVQWEEGWDFPHMVDLISLPAEGLYHTPEEIIKLRKEYAKKK